MVIAGGATRRSSLILTLTSATDIRSKDGDALVILLGGRTKKDQDRDIATAHMRWKDYKERKSQET